MVHTLPNFGRFRDSAARKLSHSLLSEKLGVVYRRSMSIHKDRPSLTESATWVTSRNKHVQRPLNPTFSVLRELTHSKPDLQSAESSYESTPNNH
jgi:hypothetical protein